MHASRAINGEITSKIYMFSNWKYPVWRLVDLLFKTKNQICDKQEKDVLRFEISSDKINILLSNHQICAADIRCLDANSKQCLKTLCLKTCLRNTSLTQTL